MSYRRPKLPKQWKHWCKKLRLRPESKCVKATDNWAYLNGQGRKWRIAQRNANNQSDCIFQAGDLLADFDRWAISERRNFEIPKTWEEFKNAVHSVRGLKSLTTLE